MMTTEVMAACAQARTTTQRRRTSSWTTKATQRAHPACIDGKAASSLV